MYGFTRDDIDIDAIRARLARMRDDDLLAYGRAAAFLAARTDRETWLVLLTGGAGRVAPAEPLLRRRRRSRLGGFWDALAAIVRRPCKEPFQATLDAPSGRFGRSAATAELHMWSAVRQ